MIQHLEGRRNALNVQQSAMTTLTQRGSAQPANLNFPRIPRAVTMVTLRSVAVHRVMVARKRMTKPILSINSEIVEGADTARGPAGQGHRILHYSTHVLYVSDVLCHP